MNINVKAVLGLLLLLITVGMGGKYTSVPIESEVLAQCELANEPKRVVGPVVTVSESETDMQFLARVDTGAKTSSMHAAEKQVLDASEYMENNVGKTIRIRIENRNGESKWIERKIADVRKIRTSEGEETRYLVPMQLTVDGVKREVLTSLNDRSRMTYSMLLGRNFLKGCFVVDVTGADEDLEMLASGL